MPFAKLGTGIEFVEVESGQSVPSEKLDAAHLKVFRNACDDDKSDNGTGEWLYGTNEGDEGYVYWYGVAGRRKVILRKVAKDSYASLSGAKFNMYRGNSSTVFELKDKATNTSVTMDDSLLVSQSSGVFWIGTLPYGTYFFDETTAPTSPTGYSGNADKWFYFILDGDYQIMSKGYGTQVAAKADAKTDNDAIKLAKKIIVGKMAYSEVDASMKAKVKLMLELVGKGSLAQ